MKHDDRPAVIFDMDGTLWDASAQIVTAWNRTLEGFAQIWEEITLEQLQAQLGKPMDEIAVALFPWLSYRRAVELMDICAEEENRYLKAHGAVLYEGLEDTLKILQKNYGLYIVSNCQKGYIEAFLAHYGFENYFQDIECYGNTLQGKSDNIRTLMERNRIRQGIYVGDTQGDADASAKASIPFIYAAYGFGTVKKEDMFGRILGLEQLPEVLQTWQKTLQDTGTVSTRTAGIQETAGTENKQ